MKLYDVLTVVSIVGLYENDEIELKLHPDALIGDDSDLTLSQAILGPAEPKEMPSCWRHLKACHKVMNYFTLNDAKTRSCHVQPKV
jgi:hypothetical protein